jgi:hypothetical protein
MTFTDSPVTQLLRASTAWRMRRSHRAFTTRVVQIRCAACRRCRDCTKGRDTAHRTAHAATSG